VPPLIDENWSARRGWCSGYYDSAGARLLFIPGFLKTPEIRIAAKKSSILPAPAVLRGRP